MKTPKSTFFLLMLSLALESAAQQEANLMFNWDMRRSRTFQQVNQVIASTNGDLIAVGETLGSTLKERDGLFMVVRADDGQEVSKMGFSARGEDVFNAGVQHPDGSFILVGNTRSGKEPVNGWVIRADLDGKKLFEQVLPGIRNSNADIRCIAVNRNGVAMAAGWQNDQRFEGIWLLKINGETVTEFTIGGGELGRVEAITSGADGGFVLTGTTPKEYRPHPSDIWVLKVDEEGRDLWGGPKFFGDSGWQEGMSVIGTSDGGYALLGSTATIGAGMADKWLIKLNAGGEKLWDRTYGGSADDIGMRLIELSEGGYALFGQTWSNMIRAKYATLDLLIVDETGKKLDDNTYPIRQVESEGNEKAFSLTELFTGDIVFAGSAIPSKSDVPPASQVSAVSYKSLDVSPRARQTGKDFYGSDSDRDRPVSLSTVTFFDPNADELLEAGERGYLALEITNTGHINLNNLTANVDAMNKPEGLSVWEDIKIGTLRAGQKKMVFVPVSAKNMLPAGDYQVDIRIATGGNAIGSTRTTLKSGAAEPPKLMAEGHFNPNPPAPGTPVALNVRLVNTGGTPTQPMDIRINVPPGVNALDSESIPVPALRPNERRDITFSFTYGENFPLKTIDIVVNARGEKMAPFVRTFKLETGKQAPSGSMSEQMVWVSHEPRKEGIPINNNEVRLKIAAISKNKLDQEKFALMIAGKKVEGQKMNEAELTPPESNGERNVQYYSQTIKLKEGENKVQIVYDGATSFKSPVITFNYSPKDKPNLYVMSIGVKHKDLKYTCKDAQDFAYAYGKLQNEKGTGFKNIKVWQLFEEKYTTTQNIKIAFEELRKERIKDGDLVVVFISSHGKVTNDNEFLLIPSDYRREYENVLTVNFETDILSKLRNLDGNKLVFIDACHSGSVTDGAKEFSDDAASKVLKDLINATAGLEIFASCGEHEYSYEDDSWQNGAFTKAIIEAFNNVPVDVGGKMISADRYADNPVTGRKENGSDGVITIGELREFLQLRVPFLVSKTKGEAQHPINRSTDLLPENTGIYMVDKKF